MSNELEDDETQEGSDNDAGNSSSEVAERIKLLLQQKLRHKGLETIRWFAKTDPESVLSALEQSDRASMPYALRLLMGRLQLAKVREIEPLENYITLAREHLSLFPGDVYTVMSIFRDDLAIPNDAQAETVASIFSALPPTLTVLSYRTLWASLWLPQRAREAASKLREEIAAVRQRYLVPVAQQDKGFAELIASISLARNIAIVGSGPSLKGARQGAKIDAHDLIIRTNFPPIGGVFAEDVGSRADVALIGHTPGSPTFKEMMSDDYRSALVVQASMSPEKHYLPFTAEDLTAAGVSRFTRVPQHVWSLLHELSYPRATSGFSLVVFIALLLDRPVSIFGFDFFQSYAAHYWPSKRLRGESGTDPIRGWSQHEPWFEKRMVEKMLKIHFGVA